MKKVLLVIITFFIGLSSLVSSQLGPLSGQELTGPTILEIPITNTDQTGVVETIENNIEQLPEISALISSGLVFISEIFPKDTAFLGEYIVIESLVEYEGAVEVVGLGQGGASKVFTTTLHSGQKLYITDTPSKISNTQAVILTLPSITLTDGGEELQIKLTGGVVTDYLFYQGDSTDQALFYSSTEPNGHRLFTSFGLSTALTSYSGSNMSGDLSTGTTTTSGTVIDTGDNQLDTGSNILTGELSGNTILPPTTGVSCPDEYSKPVSVKVTEIHPHDTEQFPEYIELFIEGTIYSPITLHGLGQGQADKTILLSGQQGYIIVTDDKILFPSSTNIIELSSISLTDSGEPLQIIRQSGQVLDSTVYVAGIQGKSLYPSTSGDQSIFSSLNFPSPGFDLSQANHLLFDNNLTSFYSCFISLQNTEPFFAGRKINLIASSNNKELQNSNENYSCERQFNDTEYEFTGCNPSFYNYSTGGIYTVGVSIKDLTTLQTCQTTLSVNYPNDTTKGQSCKQTYYEELYLKRKGKFEYLKKGIGVFGLTANATGDVSQKGTSTGHQLTEWTGKVHIVSILPNPAGKDDNQESITLKNTDTVSYDLTQFVLFNGKSRKKFPAETPPLLPNQTVTITAALGLTNRPTCVSLQNKTTIFGTFCYPQAADDQVFTKSMDNLLAVSTQDPALLSQITVALEATQACALFNKQQVICKALKYADDLVKEFKKQAKKTTSIEKKLTKEQTRTSSYKTKYDDQRKKRAQDKATFSSKLKAQKALEVLARNQTRLLQGYTNLIFDELQTNRYDVYKNSSIPRLRALYTNLLLTLKNNTQANNLWGITLPAQDIEIAYLLTEHGTLPLQETGLDMLYFNTFKITKQTVDDLLENLTMHTHQKPP